MINCEDKSIYKAFGLTIASDFKLPELPYDDIGEVLADIVIMKADLSEIWAELEEPDNYFVIKENYIMFQVPNTAIYIVKDGHEIFVSPLDGADEDHIRLFILGTCMGGILLQRKVLPLHGSAVIIDNKAYAIVGESGAGKSTLASAFLKKGYQFLSDDVIPVTLSKDGIAHVVPAYPQQKLWIESLDHFGMDAKYLRPIINRETKYAVPVSDQFATNPVPLAGVFELVKSNSPVIKVHSIKNLNRLSTLYDHTYRNMLISSMDMLGWHFYVTTKIASEICMYQLERPESYFTATDLVDVILNKIERQEIMT